MAPISIDNLSKIMADVLGMPESEITDRLAVRDCELWDSLKHMDLIVTLEQSYGIELSADEIVSMTSVGEIKRVLRNKGVC